MGKYWDRDVLTAADERTSPDASAHVRGTYWQRATGQSQPQAEGDNSASAAPAHDANQAQAEAMGGGFVRDVGNLIRGTRDPRFADVHGIHGQMVQEKNRDVLDAHSAAQLTGASDPALGDIYQEKLGDRFVSREQDENGYDVITFKGDDGQLRKGYVNRPGLDMEDVSRTITSSLPYLAVGGGTGSLVKGAGVAVRAASQGTAAAATSLAGDAASMGLGSQQGLDAGKALVTGAAGVGGELLAPAASAIWRRFVTEPRYFNKATGQLTDEGAAAAKAAGYDPSKMTAEIQQEFGKTYARTGGDASSAVSSLADKEFGIPSTLGQRTKDPQQLLDEKAMRYGVQGQGAKETITAFDQAQATAVRHAVLDGNDNVTSIAQRIAPGRTSAELSPSILGPQIRSGMQSAQGSAKAGEQAAWDKVSDLTPKPEAFDSLPDILSRRLGALPVDEVNTPIAAQMAKDLDGYVAGKAVSKPVANVLKQTQVITIDQMRRRLLSRSQSAANPTDHKAAQEIYDGFNDWIDDAAQKSLLNGDVDAAAALRTARDATKTMRQAFAPTDLKGRASPGARRIQDVLEKSDSAEGIVSGLFGGGPAANVPDGTIEALRLIKGALSRYVDPDAATQTFNDVRAAYWVRLVREKTGEVATPGVMLRNIKLAQNNQGSVIRELYSVDEQAAIMRLRRALEQITLKDPNPSGSGTAIAAYARQFVGKVLDALPLGQIAYQYSGIPSAAGRVAAKRAISQSHTAPPPALGHYGATAANSALSQGNSSADLSSAMHDDR